MTEQTPAEAEFESAWGNARYTRAELPPVDVNRILAQRYVTEEPLAFNRAMLWDMEVRKAGNPGAFIPYVVKEGTGSGAGCRGAGQQVRTAVAAEAVA